MEIGFFWILGGIPLPSQEIIPEYYIIPSDIIARNVSAAHRKWLQTPGKKGQRHKDNTVRTVHLPPYKNLIGWDISEYKNRWDLIENQLKNI